MAVLFIEGFSKATNEAVAGFWKAACVLSLSYTGLGAIGWFVKAHEKFLMSGKDFLKKISIPALGPFIFEYVHLAERPNKKWIFCRLLSDTALANLSSTSMPIATCLFVALSATNTSLTDELWDIVPLARISKIDMATGFAMAEIFLKTRTEDGWAESLDAQSNVFQQKLKAEGMVFLTNARQVLLDKAKSGSSGVSIAPALNVPSSSSTSTRPGLPLPGVPQKKTDDLSQRRKY